MWTNWLSDPVLRATIEGRLWEKIIPEPNSGCWLWTGSVNGTGHGQIRIGGHNRPPHRVMYELAHGPVSSRLDMDHLCRIACCVNPAHLEPVTHQENCARGHAGKHQSQKTHCPSGHEYTAANTRWQRKGRCLSRICRECDRRTSNEYYHRKKDRS
jgi:hypothetical protein